MAGKKKASNKKAIIVVFDCSSDEKFFIEAKRCLQLILERKLLTNSADFITLVTCGEKVSIKSKLDLPTWDLLRFVQEDLEPSGESSDWLEGVVLATEAITESNLDNAKPIIIIISDFGSIVSSDKLEKTAEYLKGADITLTVIGPLYLRELLYEDEPETKRKRLEERQSSSYKLVRDFWALMGDSMEVTTLQGALKDLATIPCEQGRSVPWNCSMNIGEIRIEVSAYIKTKKGAKKPITRTKAFVLPASYQRPQADATADAGAQSASGATSIAASSSLPPDPSVIDKLRPVISERIMTVRSDHGESTVVTRQDLGQGYPFGYTIVPFSHIDKEQMWYKSGDKCLSVLGFTNLEKLQRHHVMGDGSHVVLANKKHPGSGVAMAALVEAMVQLRCAAVARKVYSKDRGLELVALIPTKEEVGDGQMSYFLTMVCLAWKEDVNHVNFPPLDPEITDEQYQAVDNLIDSMDLMTADTDLRGEPCEALTLDYTREEKTAFYNACVVQRALYPDRPIPKELPEHHTPFRWAEEPQKALKDAFNIKYLREVKEDVESYRKFIAQLEKPDPASVFKSEHPKPLILDSDTFAVKEIKTLFQRYRFPNCKALIYVVTDCLRGSGEPDCHVALAALENCVILLRPTCTEELLDEFNNWMESLVLAAPRGFIFDFLQQVAAGPNGLISVD